MTVMANILNMLGFPFVLTTIKKN